MIKVLTAKAHANGPIISPRSDAVSSVRNREAHIVAVPVDILKPLARDLLPLLIGRSPTDRHEVVEVLAAKTHANAPTFLA